MANEFKHKDPGSALTQAEYISASGCGHIFACQATGDILYASSATVLKNLAKGSANEILSMGGSCIPDWTSTPTLAALTVDDVAINGKVVTMTGSACDTIVMTAAANGAFSLVTTDTAAAAANIQITADGTVDIDSEGVLTLDSGAAINIEPHPGSAILLDGTISIDAGVVTGATSITSTAFVGALTGNASGTAATVTGGTQAAITSAANLVTVGTIGTGVWQGTAIASGYIAANAVTLAKMAGGTDGQIITYDASGDPVAVGPGCDGQVLTSTGAGSPPAFEDAGGGAWNLIGTATGAGCTLTVTGLSSTYDTYAIAVSDVDVPQDTAAIWLRVGTGTACSPSICVGTNDYAYHRQSSVEGSTAYGTASASASGGITYMQITHGTGNCAGSAAGGMFFLHRPTDGVGFPVFTGSSVSIDGNNDVIGGSFVGARLGVVAVTQLQIQACTSSMGASTRLTVWGIAHA